MVIFHGYVSHNQMVIGELLKHQISPVKKHKMVPSHGITTSAAEMASLVGWWDESWLNPVRLGWMVKLSKTHAIIGQPSNQEPRIVGPTCNVIRWDYIYITHRTHLYPTLFVWSKDGSWPQKHRNRSPRIYYRYPIYVYPPVNQHSHGHGPFINRWFTRFTIWISIAMEDQEIVRTFHLQSRSQLKHLHLWLTFHTALWCFPLFHLDLKIFKTDKVR